jgi:ATP-dependent exoDNAse (exonuclease V) beta subunit
VFQKESKEEAEEELRRLFFVATTRAEKHLYISFPSFTNEGKALEASRFIAEMNGDDNLKIDAIKLDEEKKLKYSVLRYGAVQQPQLEAAEKDFINELLKNFKMNVTALNNYLDCPVKFYYASLIRVPSAINESAQFGSSMHDALNFYYNKMMEENVYPAKSVLLSRFQWHITQHREVFTPQSLQRFTDYGVQCLTAFYAQFFEEGARADFIRTEVPMEAVLHEIPIKGFADKIQYWGNDILITDFKTGSLEKSSKTLHAIISKTFQALRRKHFAVVGDVPLKTRKQNRPRGVLLFFHHLVVIKIQRIVHAATKLCTLVNRRRHTNKRRIIKLNRAVQIIIQRRYVHFKILQQLVDKIFFGCFQQWLLGKTITQRRIFQLYIIADSNGFDF